MNDEKLRLKQNGMKWKKWGPYLTERQWGTVREDYSPNGTAWEYISHDAARSRAYRWGEEGIAGISDERQLLCFAPAFWNGVDPILKERQQEIFLADIGIPIRAYDKIGIKFTSPFCEDFCIRVLTCKTSEV